jgi:hypothetical protein
MALAPFVGPQRDRMLLAVLAVAIDDAGDGRQEQFVRTRLMWTLERERLLREGQFARCSTERWRRNVIPRRPSSLSCAVTRRCRTGTDASLNALSFNQ